ncbi:MAG: type II CRISPR-associated endonuclease Cas1 [Desulfovibrionaceae bacterium]
MILTISNKTRIRTQQKKLFLTDIDTQESLLIPYKDITLLIIEGIASSVSIQALLELNRNNIHVIFCDEKYYPTLHIVDLYSHYKLTERIHEQVAWEAIRKKCCFQYIIQRKLQHQIELLEYLQKTHASEYLRSILFKIEHLGQSINEVISAEGVSARVYFQALFSQDFKRHAEDIYNISLNYGYALLRSLLAKAVVAKGLHPAIGIQHKNVFNNYNLVDDLIEIFRPMVDYIVYTIVKPNTMFTKEIRKQLLQVVFQKIEFLGKLYPINYVIEKYVNMTIDYMNQSVSEYILPHLVISAYDYE